MTSQSLSGRRVLVVEDEMLVLMITEDMLADAGCESVTTAATVAQALALIDTQVFDAAMLDVNLNGTESYPLADALDARGVPFFFSTGYSSQGMKDGYRDRLVLKKPFQFEDLVEILTHLPFTARHCSRDGCTLTPDVNSAPLEPIGITTH